MREHLGWVTNCDDEAHCPQNWLEETAQELPPKVSCHVCGREVACTLDEGEFMRLAGAGQAAAFPVVPASGGPASYSNGLVGDVGSGAPAPEAPRRSHPPAPAPAARTLYVLLSNGEQIPIDKDNMVLGRSRTCDVVVPSAKVSRQHASIIRAGGRYYIEDLGSANGVWKDGQRISGRAEIGDGDSITISEETVQFRFV